MDIVKNVKGITLVALAITIIVLLILTGIIFSILDNLIIDKAILASNKTIEVSLQEKIEMAWVDCNASYLMDVKDNPNIVKQDYFKQNLLDKLQNLEDVKKVNITENMNETIYITLEHKNKDYTFTISSKGKAECVYLLKGNVKVGDYIEYPIEYIDVSLKQSYTAKTGWRVIDDGVMQGTTGEVRIISTGVPVKWYYDSSLFANNQEVVNNLIQNFENLELLDPINGNTIKGDYFKKESLAKKVTTISLSDFNNAYNEIYGTNRKDDDTSNLENKNELLWLEENTSIYYWLATSSSNNDKNIYYTTSGEIRDDVDLRNGIRPIVCLNEDLTGTVSSGVWKIMN